MTLTLMITMNIVLDIVAIGLMSFTMSLAARLTPHHQPRAGRETATATASMSALPSPPQICPSDERAAA